MTMYQILDVTQSKQCGQLQAFHILALFFSTFDFKSNIGPANSIFFHFSSSSKVTILNIKPDYLKD